MNVKPRTAYKLRIVSIFYMLLSAVTLLGISFMAIHFERSKMETLIPAIFTAGIIIALRTQVKAMIKDEYISNKLETEKNSKKKKSIVKAMILDTNELILTSTILISVAMTFLFSEGSFARVILTDGTYILAFITLALIVYSKYSQYKSGYKSYSKRGNTLFYFDQQT